MTKIFLFAFLFSKLLFAQNKFKADFDYSLFYPHLSSTELEIYYSFHQNTMKPVIKDDQKTVSGDLRLVITDPDSFDTLYTNNWNFHSALKESENQDQNLTGLLKFNLRPGNYHLILIGSDLNDPGVIDSSHFNIGLVGRDSIKLSMSDIQIASNIKETDADSTSLFYKNTLEVIPNPSLIFGEGLPTLYYYCELYNADKNIQSGKLIVNHLLLNARKVPVYHKKKYIARTASSIVSIGAINVSKMPTGVYVLDVAVTDSLLNFTSETYRKIYIYNPSIIDTTVPVIRDMNVFKSELALMKTDELNNYYASSKYIATEKEKESWEKLSTDDGKKEFIYKFWENRDSDRSTPVNEMQDEYFKRVDYANKNFSDITNKQGWKSDRGRVYIIYGPPSEIERHPNETDVKPYEIWFYDGIEGRVFFVFADENGYGNYRLMHSTKRGEMIDEGWYKRISK